jgi:transcriptional regulator GlxA family with amidase domain
MSFIQSGNGLSATYSMAHQAAIGPACIHVHFGEPDPLLDWPGAPRTRTTFKVAEPVPAKPQSAFARGGLTPKVLRRVREYIDRHLDQNIELQALADAAGLSKYYFARTFKESQRMTPLYYVFQQRMKRAQQLLVETNLPIAEIAIATGFADQSHFSRRFRRQLGVTPRVFRWSTR